MKTTTTSMLAATIILAGLLAPCDLCSANDTAATIPALQGVWSGARFDSGTGDDPARGVQLTLTFADGKVTARRVPDGDIGTGEFTLSADGKTIDAVGVSKNYKGNLYQGILKIEGDTLYWCTTAGGGKTQQRPAEFAADPAKHNYLIVVKRQKP